MNLLVTAGNTQILIDRVRCLTNIFSGRTGAAIAVHAHGRGHAVTLLTSHPEAVNSLPEIPLSSDPRWKVITYRTFEDLENQMARLISGNHFRAIVHAAAVSDYRCAGVFAPAPGTRFVQGENCWQSDASSKPVLADRAAGKVKSDEPELWLRLVRTPKLVDRIRTDWAFTGILVKFKLEVDVKSVDLLDLAECSRIQSRADWMVANTLDEVPYWAYLGPFGQGQAEKIYQKVSRADLPGRLLEVLEQ